GVAVVIDFTVTESFADQSIPTRHSHFTMDDFAKQILDSLATEEALDWLRGATQDHFRSLGEHDTT
ncbi:MAG: hypothetical protein AAF664_20705, partial [Planctomycetota bacterium]